MKSLVARLLVITFLALLPSLALQVWTDASAARMRQRAMQDDALRLLHAVASEHAQIIEGASQLLTTMANLSVLNDAGQDRCAAFQPNLLQRYPRYAALYSADADGRAICNAAANGYHIDNVSDRAYFRRALATDSLVVGDYTIGRGSKRKTVHLAQRFRDGRGSVAGVVAVGLDIDWLQDRLQRLPLRAGATAFILDPQGSVIAGWPRLSANAGEQAPRALRQSLETLPDGFGTLPGLDGVRRLFATATVGPGTDSFRIVVGLDPDATFGAELHEHRRALILLGLCALLAMALTALTAGPMIWRPMNQLLAAAERWREGEFSARTGLRPGRSEFGRLGCAFDSMAAAAEERERAVRATLETTRALAESEARLLALTESLEERVREAVAAREAAQLRAAHAERMQALGQLAGGIAHDFNNVLQAVQGGASLIERRPGETDKIRRLARMIFDAAERGATITGRLLTFSRQSDLRAEPIAALPLLTDLREILGHTLGAGVEIVVAAEEPLPPFMADQGQLETVLINLATNARDAMPGGGRLSMTADLDVVAPGDAAAFSATGLASGRYVRLCVSDTGAGMPPDVLARVTEPFFTTKPQGKGTGLGLAMAKGFAEQSGGALRVESEQEQGTAITLWLPACAGVDAGTDNRQKAPAASGQGRILLVDDDHGVREVVADNLIEVGYDVVAVDSGRNAIAVLASEEPIDILVTDLSMPGMDGPTVIRAAQECRPGLPAILLTGHVSIAAELAVDGALSGQFTVLRKPITATQLAERIALLLQETVARRVATLQPDALS